MANHNNDVAVDPLSATEGRDIIETVERLLGCPDVDALIAVNRDDAPRSKKKPNTVKNLKTTVAKVQQAFDYLMSTTSASQRSFISAADTEAVLADPGALTMLPAIERALQRVLRDVSAAGPLPPPAPENFMAATLIPNMMMAETVEELLEQPISTTFVRSFASTHPLAWSFRSWWLPH